MLLQTPQLLVLTINLPNLLVSTDGLILLQTNLPIQFEQINTDIPTILHWLDQFAMFTVDLALSWLLILMETSSAREIWVFGIIFQAMDLIAFLMSTKFALESSHSIPWEWLEPAICTLTPKFLDTAITNAAIMTEIRPLILPTIWPKELEAPLFSPSETWKTQWTHEWSHLFSFYQ